MPLFVVIEEVLNKEFTAFVYVVSSPSRIDDEEAVSSGTRLFKGNGVTAVHQVVLQFLQYNVEKNPNVLPCPALATHNSVRRSTAYIQGAVNAKPMVKKSMRR